MTSRLSLVLAVALLTTPSAFAQGLSAGARLDSGPAPTRVDAPIAGTAIPMQSGRSVRRGQNVDNNGVSEGPSLESPRICTNCDD